MDTSMYPALIQKEWARQMTLTLDAAGIDWDWICEQATQRTAHSLSLSDAEVTAAMTTFHAPFSTVGNA